MPPPVKVRLPAKNLGVTQSAEGNARLRAAQQESFASLKSVEIDNQKFSSHENGREEWEAKENDLKHTANTFAQSLLPLSNDSIKKQQLGIWAANCLSNTSAYDHCSETFLRNMLNIADAELTRGILCQPQLITNSAIIRSDTSANASKDESPNLVHEMDYFIYFTSDITQALVDESSGNKIPLVELHYNEQFKPRWDESKHQYATYSHGAEITVTITDFSAFQKWSELQPSQQETILLTQHKLCQELQTSLNSQYRSRRRPASSEVPFMELRSRTFLVAYSNLLQLFFDLNQLLKSLSDRSDSSLLKSYRDALLVHLQKFAQRSPNLVSQFYQELSGEVQQKIGLSEELDGILNCAVNADHTPTLPELIDNYEQFIQPFIDNTQLTLSQQNLHKALCEFYQKCNLEITHHSLIGGVSSTSEVSHVPFPTIAYTDETKTAFKPFETFLNEIFALPAAPSVPLADTGTQKSIPRRDNFDQFLPTQRSLRQKTPHEQAYFILLESAYNLFRIVTLDKTSEYRAKPDVYHDQIELLPKQDDTANNTSEEGVSIRWVREVLIKLKQFCDKLDQGRLPPDVSETLRQLVLNIFDNLRRYYLNYNSATIESSHALLLNIFEDAQQLYASSEQSDLYDDCGLNEKFWQDGKQRLQKELDSLKNQYDAPTHIPDSAPSEENHKNYDLVQFNNLVTLPAPTATVNKSIPQLVGEWCRRHAWEIFWCAVLVAAALLIPLSFGSSSFLTFLAASALSKTVASIVGVAFPPLTAFIKDRWNSYKIKSAIDNERVSTPKIKPLLTYEKMVDVLETALKSSVTQEDLEKSLQQQYGYSCHNFMGLFLKHLAKVITLASASKNREDENLRTQLITIFNSPLLHQVISKNTVLRKQFLQVPEIATILPEFYNWVESSFVFPSSEITLNAGLGKLLITCLVQHYAEEDNENTLAEPTFLDDQANLEFLYFMLKKPGLLDSESPFYFEQGRKLIANAQARQYFFKLMLDDNWQERANYGGPSNHGNLHKICAQALILSQADPENIQTLLTQIIAEINTALLNTHVENLQSTLDTKLLTKISFWQAVLAQVQLPASEQNTTSSSALANDEISGMIREFNGLAEGFKTSLGVEKAEDGSLTRQQPSPRRGSPVVMQTHDAEAEAAAAETSVNSVLPTTKGLTAN